jgi:hypothetical protein
VSEGGIADIVRQAACGYDRRQFISIKFPELPFLSSIFFSEGIPYRLTQGTAYRGHFQAMCQPVMDKYGAWQGKYLRFVLQTAKGRRKNDSIVVPEKRGAEVGSLGRGIFLNRPRPHRAV